MESSVYIRISLDTGRVALIVERLGIICWVTTLGFDDIPRAVEKVIKKGVEKLRELWSTCSGDQCKAIEYAMDVIRRWRVVE